MSTDGIAERPGNTSGQEPEAKPSRGERLHRFRYRLLFGGLILAAGGIILSFNFPGGCFVMTEDPFSGNVTMSSCGSGDPWTPPEWVAVSLLMLSMIATFSGMVMAVLGLGTIVLGGVRRIAGMRSGHGV